MSTTSQRFEYPLEKFTIPSVYDPRILSYKNTVFLKTIHVYDEMEKACCSATSNMPK